MLYIKIIGPKMNDKKFKKTGIILLTCLLLVGGSVLKAQSQTDQKKTEPGSNKGNETTLRLEITGMHCQAGCANGVDNMLKEMKGIVNSRTTFKTGSSIIHFNKNEISENKIINSIEDRGFKVKAIKKHSN